MVVNICSAPVRSSMADTLRELKSCMAKMNGVWFETEDANNPAHYDNLSSKIENESSDWIENIDYRQ
jgi:hypothetical protein